MAHRRILASAVAATSLAIGMVSPAAATTDPLPRPPSLELPGSPATVPVAVSGQLTANGVAAAGDVVAYVWPNDETLNALPEGGTFRLLPVAHARSSTGGHYQLRIDPAAIPSSYKSRSGQIDVDVVSAIGSSQVTWSTSLRSVGTIGWVAANAAETATPAPVTLAADVTRGTVAEGGVQYDDGGTTHQAQVQTLQRSPDLTGDISHIARTTASTAKDGSATPTATVAPTSVCGPGSRAGLKTGISARVLKAQGLSNVPVTVEFSNSASSTLGIAVSDGKGGFTLGGSKTISSGAGASNTWAGTRIVYNRYNYRGYTSSGCSLTVTSWRPESTHSYISSANVASRSSFAIANCNTYSSGTKWKDRGVNVTQKGGVAFPGVNLDAQTGWNSKVKISWTFKGRAMLCGSNSHGWVTAPWAGARVA